MAAATSAAVPRERWASRFTFIVACVGSAIGLGNIWRFPYLNFRHGGGAFLIPYFIFLICTGLPLMQTELALGRLFQKGDIESFGSIHKRARGVGTVSIIGGFGVVTYYSVIIAWAGFYFAASFVHPFPWAVEDCGADAQCAADPNRALPIKSASDYFDRTILYNAESMANATATLISGPIFASLLVTWVVAYFCIWKGVASVGHAIKATVFLPWILLVVMLIYNATLEGAGDGVKAYIGRWDMSVLQDGSAWSDAAGQIFFTLGATLGIMSAYGSYAPTTTNVWADNNYIGYINCATSLVAGFVVFEILGNMAFRQRSFAAENPDLRFGICEQRTAEGECDIDCNMCLTDGWEEGRFCCGYAQADTVAASGFALAFAVYPATMQYLGSAAGHIMSILWFGTLWLLGIDSMFAMVEGVATVITDTPRYRHLRKEQVALFTCIIGFVVSVTFATDIGLGLLDMFDHYIINYGLFVTGALEAYTVSWVWGWRETRDKAGFASAAAITGGFTAAVAAGCGIAGALHYAVDPGVNIGIGFAVGAIVGLIAVVVAFVLRSNKEQSFMQWVNVWALAGTRNLRYTFQHKPKPWQTIVHILTFDIMIKYVCPPALLGLFINQAIADATQYENGYGDYPNWVHAVVGIFVLGLMMGSLFLFMLFPGFWDHIGGTEEAGTLYNNGAAVGADKHKVSESEMEHDPYLPQLRAEDDGWGRR